jgi:cytidylate kinase-like protein
MSVWTISAQIGTGGDRIAAELAERADVPLLDRHTLASHLEDIGDIDSVERRVCSRLNAVGLTLALTTGVPEAYRELRLRHDLPALGRRLLADVTRQPAVVLAHAAFAALGDHPSAVHVRLRAPFAWRVDAVRREELLDRERAERHVRQDDQLHAAWVRALYHVDLDEPAAFTLVLDASRLAPDRIVELLLAAAASRVPA